MAFIFLLLIFFCPKPRKKVVEDVKVSKRSHESKMIIILQVLSLAMGMRKSFHFSYRLFDRSNWPVSAIEESSLYKKLISNSVFPCKMFLLLLRLPALPPFFATHKLFGAQTRLDWTIPESGFSWKWSFLSSWWQSPEQKRNSMGLTDKKERKNSPNCRSSHRARKKAMRLLVGWRWRWRWTCYPTTQRKDIKKNNRLHSGGGRSFSSTKHPQLHANPFQN